MKQYKSNKKSGVQVMVGLAKLLKPLFIFMLIAIIMGWLGNLMAIGITVTGGILLSNLLGITQKTGVTFGIVCMLLFALFRGILRYAEQASNHFIAFKLLAKIRHDVFAALRKLAPAKLEGSDKGNIISIITSDIELLEVFYAHTISPIVIAILTSCTMCLFFAGIHPWLAVIAAVFYVLVGAVIPIINSKKGQAFGNAYRGLFGRLNTVVLDNLYGLDEILQYGQENKRLTQMTHYSQELEKCNHTLKKQEGVQKIATDAIILMAGVIMTVVAANEAILNQIEVQEVMIAAVAMMSSFGPVAALSALSNNLNQTLASGRRVLELLEEEPETKEIVQGTTLSSSEKEISVRNISFSYQEKNILSDFSALFRENKIHGILGNSGCGKSTLLKLLMRFYETKQGEIDYQGTNVNQIITKSLRNQIAYVTQDTFLFDDTIAENIRIAKENATMEEIILATKKASIHEFIASLPKGYETRLKELGEGVSGGERQRIGLARAFLYNAPIIFLDEPTSNLDSLNEAIILNSLKKGSTNKTILLVSHRKSTMGVADSVIELG